MLLARATARLCLFALCASSPGETERRERTIERSFGSELELRTDSFELTGSEEDQSVEQAGPLVTREQADELEAVDTLFDDEVPPAKFERFYRTVMSSLRFAGQGEPQEKTASAGLEGKRVLFERDDEGGYERSCDAPDVRQGQLERLRADLSLAPFLPPDELEPGASWELAFEPFAVVLAPAGDTRPRRRHVPVPKSGLNLAPSALTEPLWTLLASAEGEATAVPVEAGDDEDYPRRAELEFRFESSFDGSQQNFLAGKEAEIEDEVEVVWKGTGTVEWDPGDGRIHVELDGELIMEETFTVRVENNGKTGEVEGRLSCSGSLELEASEERGE